MRLRLTDLGSVINNLRFSQKLKLLKKLSQILAYFSPFFELFVKCSDPHTKPTPIRMRRHEDRTDKRRWHLKTSTSLHVCASALQQRFVYFLTFAVTTNTGGTTGTVNESRITRDGIKQAVPQAYRVHSNHHHYLMAPLPRVSYNSRLYYQQQ